MKTGLFITAAAIALAGPIPVSFASEGSMAGPSQKGPAASLYDLGVAASHAKHFPEALRLFEQALKKDPGNADVLNMLAHTQRELGHLDLAIANYHRALELRPHFREAMQYLSEAYVEVGEGQAERFRKSGDIARLDEAIADYRKALALTPHSAEAREYLGEAYLAAALDQVRNLKQAGDGAKEELEDLSNEFKKAVQGL